MYHYPEPHSLLAVTLSGQLLDQSCLSHLPVCCKPPAVCKPLSRESQIQVLPPSNLGCLNSAVWPIAASAGDLWDCMALCLGLPPRSQDLFRSLNRDTSENHFQLPGAKCPSKVPLAHSHLDLGVGGAGSGFPANCTWAPYGHRVLREQGADTMHPVCSHRTGLPPLPAPSPKLISQGNHVLPPNSCCPQSETTEPRAIQTWVREA